MDIKESDDLEFVFKTKDGKEISAVIPFSIILEHTIDNAYEIITMPECGSSSCSVNNFCECDPINDDAEFSRLKLIINN